MGLTMKKIVKKIVSIMLTIALAITGISYVPSTTVKAAGTIVTDAYTAEITDGTMNFEDSETVGAVTYNNYIRYGAAIADKSAEDTDDGCLADYAIDNDSTTRWADKNSEDSGYITIDLGAAYSINKVYVNWEVANAKSYKIQYSNDGTDFTDAVTIDSSTNGTETAYSGDRIDKVTLNNEIKGRYVRIQVVERCIKSDTDSSHPHGGVSIREIGVYGISEKAVGIDTTAGYTGSWTDESSSDGWKTAFGATDTDSGSTLNNYVGYNKYRTVTASADLESGNKVAAKAIDGIAGSDNDGNDSRWAAETKVDGHWLTINLGTEYNIKKICISWETAQSEIYNIETSNDGVNFDTAATVNATCWNKSKVDKITLADTVKAQYVRIYTLKRANGYGSSIWEIGIYGPDSEAEQTYETNAFDGYAATSGNKIEAEGFSNDISSGVAVNNNTKLSNGGNLGNSIAGSVAGYKVYFDRKTSKVKFNYSAKSSNAAGNIKMYVDDMSGSPVATIATSATGEDNWDTYVDVETDVEISQGDHKIFLVFEPSDGMTYVANIDYFQFEYAPEAALGEHEAENAHAYVVGSMDAAHSIQVNDAFSNGQAVGNMNTNASSNNPAYFTTYVQASKTGIYQLKIKYATSVATKIAYRIDDGDWTNVDAAATGDWNTVGTLTANTSLSISEGIHKIDITGALMEDGTEWANIDSFVLEESAFEKNAFEYRNTSLTGNKIEAEEYDVKSGDTTAYEDTSSGQSGTGYLGSTSGSSWTQYNIHFDRKTSKVKFSYSAKYSNAAGNIKMYVDDMTGTPVATIKTEATSTQEADDWKTYVDVETDVEILQGDHKIYLVFEPDDGKTYVGNIDYFQFEYTPEDVEVKNEAENAHSYTQSGDYEEQTGSNFSGGKAIGTLNTWVSDERAYLTTYVNAVHAGTYKLTIAYATANSTTTQINYRVNGTDDSSWQELDAAGTGAWDSVKTITAEVTLNKGVNIIDISGARNTWAEGKDWEYVNLDYFRLDRVLDETNIALGKPVTSGATQSDHTAENAVDGDNDTRWAANSKDDNWLTIDLQGMYEIEEVGILFERAYASGFEIQVSRDNATWVTARTVTNFNEDADIGEGNTIEWVSPGESDPDYVCLGKAAYIRIKINEVGASYERASIYEVVVRGEKVPGELSDVALNKTVTASSSNGLAAENAVDGKDDTRWSSDKGASQWYQIDLGGEYELHSIDLKFERAYAQNFVLQVSDDGKTWADAYTKTGWDEPGRPRDLSESAILGYSIHLDSVQASYVRLNVTGLDADGCWNGLSIYEFEVWGKDLSKSDYWKNQKAKSYGIYPVSGLQETETDGTLDSSLVQGDVLGTDDTYEVIYEPGKEIYFYVNPRDFKIDYNSYTVCWSSAGTNPGLWGADSHDEGIADYQTQNQATVKYILPENLDFGDSKEVTTEIGCQIYSTSDLQDGKVVDGKTPKFNMKFTIKVIKSSFSILDTIKQNGCISVKDPETDAKYEWQKSDDGETWSTVSENRYDLTIITDNGQKVNVANDLGGGMYYRVRKQGTEEWSYAYQIPYYNNVQNGGFEYPAMYSPDESGALFPFGTTMGNEQQYPNGLAGMVWKTTGPGWNSKVGHDIEIVNGRRLKTSESSDQVSRFSVTLEQMYQSNQYGDQFAELNCENIGALYQDILTTPNSTCSWELDHAGRWNQNSMFVVAMSAEDAENYTTSTQIAQIVKTAQEAGIIDTKTENAAGVTVTLENGEKATIWKVTSPETKGVWEHHSGTYSVPEGDSNYLTRFFFASEEGASNDGGSTKDDTVGNLLDNVTFEMRQSYTIEYYLEDETEESGYKLVSTVSGEVQPYDRVSIPSSIEGYDLDTYTLSKAIINDTNYYMDGSGLMTVAYGHNNLKLYYNTATIAVTKKIEGLDVIPEGYGIQFSLTNSDGTLIGSPITLSKDDFTKVEKNGDEAEGYFAMLAFKGTTLGIVDNTNVVVTEKLVPMIEGTSYYLEQVEIDGEVNKLDTNMYFDGTGEVSYSKTFTYYTDAANTVSFINIYKSTHKVTVTKNVISKYLDLDIGNDKSFQFTLNVKMGDAAVKALSYGTGVTESSNAGEYTFELKDDENVELSVLDGCTVTVEEDDYSKEFYSVQWSGSGAAIEAVGRKATIDDVDMDTALICTNTNVYYGDVEVQGFQMNTDNSEGGVSEYSPSFRVVSRACKMLIGSDGELHNVTAYGTVYALDSAVKDSYNGKLRLDQAANSEDVYSKDDINTNVYYFESQVGTYLNWTTRQPEDPYYNYFALTFVMKSYSYSSLETDMAFRAYAKLDNGEIVYGTKVYSVNVYQIAENLYENTKMGTKEAHDFLYTNVLNLVTMNQNRVQICQSMMVALGVTTTADSNYALINKINKDINDYVYCQNGYSYSGRTDFSPKSLTSTELDGLMDALGTAVGTDYSDKTLSDWIYNETPKIRTYKGFYERVPYDWDNSIYKDFNTK